MNNILENYLDKIFVGEEKEFESIFPIDSPHTGKSLDLKKKNKKVMKVIYPEGVDPSFQDKKRVMIDFDGVIHSYDKGWQNGEIYGSVIEGAKESIDELKRRGYEVVIFTTRASNSHNIDPTSDKLISDMELWLRDNGIQYDQITAEKLGAVIYIDDRAIRFEGSWNDTISKVDELEVTMS